MIRLRTARRWTRTHLSMLFAFVVAFLTSFVGSAGLANAQELRELPAGPETTAAPRSPSGPALVLPRDVPVVLSAAQVRVPPLPVGYVTKDLGWLRFSYPPAAAERIEPLLRDADTVKAELTEALGQQVLEHVEIRIAQTTADMARLAPLEAPPPEYADGVAYPRLRLILLSMLAPRGAEAVEMERVFRHELAHVALEDAVVGQHVPAWFNEGLAMVLSGEKQIDRIRALWNATISGSILPLSELDRSFPVDPFEVSIAYAQSADFMGFLMRRSDKARFSAMVRRIREGVPFERAMSDAYGSDLRKLEFQWRCDLERRYSVFPILTGGGIIWIAVIGALGYAYMKKRRRAKNILARWEREEAIEDAIRARIAADAAANAEAAERVLGSVPVGALRASASPARVEHDGRWHTLH